jgi:hypothetical protein
MTEADYAEVVCDQFKKASVPIHASIAASFGRGASNVATTRKAQGFAVVAVGGRCRD